LTNETFNYYLREFMIAAAAWYLKNARKLKFVLAADYCNPTKSSSN